MSYETYRDLNGALSLVCALTLLAMGVWLLWRGGHERPWWRPVPGRLVIGATIVVYAVARIEEASWRLVATDGPGQVGRRINDGNTVAMLAASVVLFVWSLVRVIRNDLEARR
jgi:hypothetical protein